MVKKRRREEDSNDYAITERISSDSSVRRFFNSEILLPTDSQLLHDYFKACSIFIFHFLV